jgi:putative ABC transport system ATP-binding protein
MNNPMLELKKVCFSAPSREQLNVNHVSFSVNAGDFIILLGSNGSGKSSLINLINKTYALTSGRILLFNKQLNEFSSTKLAKTIVTLTQNTAENLFMDMSIAENARLSHMRGKNLFELENKHTFFKSFKEYLKQFHAGLAERLNTPVNKLSGGERQILTLALQLQHNPDLILLDEHTSALDPKTADLIMEKTYQAISTRKMTCIMTTHNLDFALKYGNRLLAINQGKIVHIVSEKEKAQLTKTDLLQDCYS